MSARRDNGIRWNSSVEPLRPSKRRVSSALPNHSRQATFPMVQERPATLPILKRRIKSAPIGRPLSRGGGSDVIYSDVVKRRSNPLERVPPVQSSYYGDQQRRWNSGGWVTNADDEEESDDEWDELLFELDEESYWNKKLSNLLIISQIPLHLRTRADKLEWLKRQFRLPRTGAGGLGRNKQRPTTAQLERLLDSYERKKSQDDDDHLQSATNRTRKKNKKGFDLEAVDEGDESDSDEDFGTRNSGRGGLLTGRGGDGFGSGSGDDSDHNCSKCEGNGAANGAATGGNASGRGSGTGPTGNGIGTTGSGIGTPLDDTGADMTFDGPKGSDRNRGTERDSLDRISRGNDTEAETSLERSDAGGLYGSGSGDMMRDMLNRKKGGELTNSRSSMASALSTVSRRSRRSDIANTQQGYGFRGGTELNDVAAISTAAGTVGNKTGLSGHRTNSYGTDGMNTSGTSLGKNPGTRLDKGADDASGVDGKRTLKAIHSSSRQKLLSSSRIRGGDLDADKDLQDGGARCDRLSSGSRGLLGNDSQVAKGPPPHTRPVSFSLDTDDGEMSPGRKRDGGKLRSGKKKLLQLPDLYSLGITRAFTYSYFTLPNQYREEKERFASAAWGKPSQGKK